MKCVKIKWNMCVHREVSIQSPHDLFLLFFSVFLLCEFSMLVHNMSIGLLKSDIAQIQAHIYLYSNVHISHGAVFLILACFSDGFVCSVMGWVSSSEKALVHGWCLFQWGVY